MELTLRLEPGEQVKVFCDGQESHTFALADILPDPKSNQENIIVLDDPVETGRRFFQVLFRTGTKAEQSFSGTTKRILLVTTDKELDAIPWEYLYGPDGYLVLDFDFVRGLPPEQRQPKPDMQGTPLHIVAVPSNPISDHITPLDIDGEWQRLKEGVEGIDSAIRLERARPPTIEQTRRLVANQKNRVLHFMGHGGTTENEAVLLFEDERGAPKGVTAQDFVRRLDDTTFLVVLNSCKGATTGQTEFSNLALSLVLRNIPYAIGMRFEIPDEDAKDFSRTFYDELTRGVPVESALRHARQVLADSKNPWAIGIPVLYTSLQAPAGGFERSLGKAQVEEHQPPMDIFILPKAKGAFQGRVDELLALGKALTTEPRVKLLTIHGSGGQGKTALAREAAERFAYAWPGGVFAISLETRPNRASFCFQLAQFLKLPTDQLVESSDLERAILFRLHQQRTLLVLDNAETFTEAVRGKDPEALDLVDFLRERLLGTLNSLLVTSREPLGWPREQVLFLEGLNPQEGAALFLQSASQRQSDIQMEQAEALSVRLDGHPLALLLLGLAFNETAITMEQLMLEHQARLLQAEDRYKGEDHRHRTLYASIETSVRYLDHEHRQLLSGLWIFQAPFLPETAAELFAIDGLSEEESKSRQEQIIEQLYDLFRRGLLVREVETLADGNLLLYRTLPTVRLFAQHYLEQELAVGVLQSRLGSIHNELLVRLYTELDRSNWASYMAIHSRVDLEASLAWVEEKQRGWYANGLGRILHHLGDQQAGLRYLERALEEAQGTDQKLELHVLNNLGEAYLEIGQPAKALAFHEQALRIWQEVRDRNGEATTLGNMGAVYGEIGQPSKALELYQKALPIHRKFGEREGEAAIISKMATVYTTMGQPGKALEMYEQALLIMREGGNRTNEAATLGNMGAVYHEIGQPDKALELYEQAFSIQREVGDRNGGASTINSVGELYRTEGQPRKALELYQEALRNWQEVGNRNGEATALHNIGMVYQSTGQPGKALELYEQVLPIERETGDRAGEATTLNNMAGVYQATGQPGKALELYEQALSIRREVDNPAGEAATCFNMALLARDLRQDQRALELLRQAVLLEKQVQYPDYPRDAALLARWEAAFANGEPLQELPYGLSAEQVQTIQHNTLAVLRDVPEKHGEWRQVITQALSQGQTATAQTEIEFFTAILTILDGKAPEIPPENPYAAAVHDLSRQLTQSGQTRPLPEGAPLPMDLPSDFVVRCVDGLNSSLEERQALFDYLREVNRKTTSPEVSVLIKNVQYVLWGKDPTSLNPSLSEPYAAVWQQIIAHLN